MEAAVNVAVVAIMDLDGTFAGRDALGMTGAESECAAGEERRGGDADRSDEKFFHDFVPVGAR